MTLGNMRANGVRSLAIYCTNPRCHRQVTSSRITADVISSSLAGSIVMVTTAWHTVGSLHCNTIESTAQPVPPLLSLQCNISLAACRKGAAAVRCSGERTAKFFQ